MVLNPLRISPITAPALNMKRKSGKSENVYSIVPGKGIASSICLRPLAFWKRYRCSGGSGPLERGLSFPPAEAQRRTVFVEVRYIFSPRGRARAVFAQASTASRDATSNRTAPRPAKLASPSANIAVWRRAIRREPPKHSESLVIAD